MLFHDENFIKKMKAISTNKVVEVQKAGHWLQIAQADLVTKEIVSFLQ